MSFNWDPFKGGGADFVKFETIGDEVVGKIISIRTHTFDKDKGEVPLIDIERTSDGEMVTLSIDKVDLKRQIADIEPQAGDMLAVKFTGEEKTPNGRKKVFAIRTKQGDRTPEPEWDQTSGPTDDFGEEPFS